MCLELWCIHEAHFADNILYIILYFAKNSKLKAINFGLDNLMLTYVNIYHTKPMVYLTIQSDPSEQFFEKKN